MKFPEADRQLLDNILFSINEIVSSEDNVSTITFYKHEMFNKVMRNYLTICQISNGIMISFNGKKAKVKDYSSLILVFRSIIETLTLYYQLFCYSKDPDDITFRFNCWQRHGLVTRQNFGNHSKNQIEKLNREKLQLEELTLTITTDKRFNLFKPWQIEKFTKYGEWDFNTEKSILKEMGFSKDFSESIYSYLSSHAHTESAGVMQVWQMHLSEQTDKMFDIVSCLVKMIVFCFLWFYIDTRDEVKSKLDTETLQLVETWKTLMIPGGKSS